MERKNQKEKGKRRRKVRHDEGGVPSDEVPCPARVSSLGKFGKKEPTGEMDKETKGQIW